MEFALVFPILIFMLVAVFDVGRAVFLYNSLTNAAREGARLALVNQSKPLIGQRVEAMAFAGAVSNLGDLDDLVMFVKQEPYNTDPETHDLCDPVAVGCVAIVKPESNWTAITPIIGTLIGPINLTARSTIQIEFVCPNVNIPAYNDPTGLSCPKVP